MNKEKILPFVKEIIVSSQNEDIKVVQEKLAGLINWLTLTKLINQETKNFLERIKQGLPEILLLMSETDEISLEQIIPDNKASAQQPPKQKEKIIERHYHHYHTSSSSGCGGSGPSYSSGCGGGSRISTSRC